MMNNVSRMEKMNPTDTNDQPNEGFMTAIQIKPGRKSIRRILEKLSLPRKDIWQKPLEEATEKQANTMILRWILDNLSAEESVLIRLRDDDGDVFELRIRNHRGCLYAKNIRQLRDAKRLYLWRKEITYKDLTIKEIEGSVRRVEEKEKKKATMKSKMRRDNPEKANELFTQTCDNSIFNNKLN